jgi:hypothetical protein
MTVPRHSVGITTKIVDQATFLVASPSIGHRAEPLRYLVQPGSASRAIRTRMTHAASRYRMSNPPERTSTSRRRPHRIRTGALSAVPQILIVNLRRHVGGASRAAGSPTSRLAETSDLRAIPSGRALRAAVPRLLLPTAVCVSGQRRSQFIFGCSEVEHVVDRRPCRRSRRGSGSGGRCTEVHVDMEAAERRGRGGGVSTWSGSASCVWRMPRRDMNRRRRYLAKRRRNEARICPIICAWCGKLLRRGNPDKPVSHGCCVRCAERLVAHVADE